MSGPGGGPVGGPGSTTTTGTPDAFADQAASSLMSVIASATGGDALEAQNIILRRIALEGDVVPSRVQAPQNITQIGGYLNLLTDLKETAMRSQVLAGILGVAGPVNQAGWVSAKPPYTFSMVPNDRPSGALQQTLPTVVPMRSDFVHAFLAAMKTLHDDGCMLPLYAGPSSLPTTVLDPSLPLDPMPYVGRVLQLAPMAFSDPMSDPVVLARNAGSTDLFQVALNSMGPASVAVPANDYDALKSGSTTLAATSLTDVKLVYLNPILASAGFYPASPLPQPASTTDTAWTTYTSVAGLIPGKTRLGDELASLYSWTAIGASVFSSMTSWVWNGTAFAP